MKIFCISCPRGCLLDVEKKGDEVLVSGNACPRGEEYGRAELVNPTRMVTGLVKVAGMRKPLSVKTERPVPKGSIDAVLFAMHQTAVQLPIKIGDVIIHNVANTSVNLVATSNM
jgi:CxxC motif-containing protein